MDTEYSCDCFYFSLVINISQHNIPHEDISYSEKSLCWGVY